MYIYSENMAGDDKMKRKERKQYSGAVAQIHKYIQEERMNEKVLL